MSNKSQADESKEPEEPVVRDKRRVDPETGELRPQDVQEEPEGSSELPADGYEDADVETSLNDVDVEFLEKAADDLAAERLEDLQRVTAEYANYRKRTEANRDIERERVVGDVVRSLLPVLDDIERADKHGDLVEGAPITLIATKLRAVTERLGLVTYGAVGEAFDPNQHEALLQQPTAEVTTPTVLEVVEPGYMLGSSQVRPAKVIVATPE
jgi:molecular chaperone GrpE